MSSSGSCFDKLWSLLGYNENKDEFPEYNALEEENSPKIKNRSSLSTDTYDNITLTSSQVHEIMYGD